MLIGFFSSSKINRSERPTVTAVISIAHTAAMFCLFLNNDAMNVPKRELLLSMLVDA